MSSSNLSQEFLTFINSLRESLPIDRDQLEHECSNQPKLYDEIGQEVVRASRISKDKKADWETLLGETELKIRKNPDSFGLPKVTDSTVLAFIRQDTAIRQAYRKYLEAEEEYMALRNLLESMAQRKSMLRDLTDLFVHNYYSSQSLAEPGERVKSQASKYKENDNRRFEEDIAKVRKSRSQQRSKERSEEDKS